MMKHSTKYLIYPLLALLLSACENDDRHAPELPSPTIDELEVRTMQPIVTTTTRAGEKNQFESGDNIYIYGFAKQTAGTAGTRFMPENPNTAGATYQYDKPLDGAIKWHRFKSTPEPGQTLGFWRTGQYHDFNAYYYHPKPTGPTIDFPMTATGLPEQELLWGRKEDELFTGQVHIIPKIEFNHQLSRIRVEVMHDIPEVASENFVLTALGFDLNKSKATFEMETGTWIDSTLTTHPIKKEFPLPGLEMNEIAFPRLKLVEVTDLWVLPYSRIEDFKIYYTQSGVLKFPTVDFESLFDYNGGVPTVIVTKPGYITTLRVQFGEIKPIIFTVSLEPWISVPGGGTITQDDEL